MSDNVQAYYDQASEKEWERLGTISRVEYLVTTRLLRDLIGTRKLKILDLGGGPGRYAIELTQQGHEVTLVDISESNLTLARKMAAKRNVTIESIICASAVDLGTLPNDHFDLALSLGPMYHLTCAEDLILANAELLRVLKPGAHALVAFITKLAVLRDKLYHDPQRLIQSRERYLDIMERGIIIQPPESGFTDLRIFHSAEIVPLMEQSGFTTECLMGCEGPMNQLLYPKPDVLSTEEIGSIFDFIYPYSTWPSLLDSSDHILFVGKKPQKENLQNGNS